MKKHLAFASICALTLFALGCGNRGQQIADKMNEKMIEKINKGDVKTENAMEDAENSLYVTISKDMGIKKDDKPSDSEAEAMKSALKKYREEWKKLIKEKWPNG